MASKFSDLPPVVQGTVLAVLPVVLAGVAFWYFVLPLSDKLTATKAQLVSLHAQNLRNQTIERQRAEFQKRIAQLQEQLAAFRSTVPDEPAPDELVRTVLEAELASTVHVRSLMAQPLAPQELYVEMPFKARLDGTYYAMVDFFSRLARAQRIVGVSKLTLGPPTSAGSGKYTIEPGATVGVNCVVSTYFNRPQSMAAPKKK